MAAMGLAPKFTQIFERALLPGASSQTLAAWPESQGAAASANALDRDRGLHARGSLRPVTKVVVIGQIPLSGGHGYMPLRRCVEICALRVILRGSCPRSSTSSRRVGCLEQSPAPLHGGGPGSTASNGLSASRGILGMLTLSNHGAASEDSAGFANGYP